jgi:hypothetical protein
MGAVSEGWLTAAGISGFATENGDEKLRQHVAGDLRRLARK